MDLWGSETVLVNYVPDPFLPHDDVIAEWMQGGVVLHQTNVPPAQMSH